MPKLTFFPLGNADCTRIDLDDGAKLLFDYADCRDPDDEDDLRCDLPEELLKDLDEEERNSYDVVAFTHLDKDHYQRASEFFFLKHADKYQSEERVKMKEMWVPAAVITETRVEDPEGRIIQREARFRFKEGRGIRVFSRPSRLKRWLENNGLRLADREHLITDAGQLIPGFSKAGPEGVEFFVHSPFATRQDDGSLEDRNDDSLVVQATFLCDDRETKLLLAADVRHPILTDIVTVTTSRNNHHRLEWDVFKLPHHCSYLSLGPEKGEDKTEPVDEVAWLFEGQGQPNGIIVSTSWSIPDKGDPADKANDPPHRQAANYYRGVSSTKEGEFKVTMEHPKKSNPRPLIVRIDHLGATPEKRALTAAAAAVSVRSPRAG